MDRPRAPGFSLASVFSYFLTEEGNREGAGVGLAQRVCGCSVVEWGLSYLQS